MSSLEEWDRQEQRRREREERRAQMRGIPTAEPTPSRSIPTPGPRPQPVPTRPAPGDAPKFRILDELPGKGTRTRTSPAIRIAARDAAVANPGRWIEYPPTEQDPYKSSSSFAGNVRAGHGIWQPEGAFEVAIRNKVVFIRYVGGAR